MRGACVTAFAVAPCRLRTTTRLRRCCAAAAAAAGAPSQGALRVLITGSTKGASVHGARSRTRFKFVMTRRSRLRARQRVPRVWYASCAVGWQLLGPDSQTVRTPHAGTSTRVVLNSRDSERVAQATQQLQAKHGAARVCGCAADVAVADDVDALVQYAVSQLGGVDIWLNNAGSNGTRGVIRCALFVTAGVLNATAVHTC